MALPLLPALLAGTIGTTLVSVVSRILISLGIGFTIMQGVQIGFDSIINLVRSHFTGLPSDFAGLIGLSGFDVFVSLVLSAYAASIFLKGVGGTIKKMRFK